MTAATSSPVFANLIDLADASVGGRALAASDDFFAECAHLVATAEPVFDPHAYTDRGKRMDGWESRRRRSDGYDWCIVELGVPGSVRAFDIDTRFFLGNHPPYAIVHAVHAPGEHDALRLQAKAWTTVLPQVALRPGSHNLFSVRAQPDWPAWTHLRLDIIPDGGVARLRAWGDVVPDWGTAPDPEAAAHVRAGEVDLAALAHGGRALACSDMFFGAMNNLVAPGRAANMGGGWETKRRRGPGFDWVVLALGAAGRLGVIEVDTNHFKGNSPDRCRLEGVYAPGASLGDLVGDVLPWRVVLPEQRLSPHMRHFFRDAIVDAGPYSHVRFSIVPDGGVSRLRLYGSREPGDGAIP